MMTTELDLHGVPHHEVDQRVENFILLNQDSVPLIIVCGNSKKMQDLVMAVVFRINCCNVAIEKSRVVVRKV